MFLDRPAIGVAKSRLIGDYREPALGRYHSLIDPDSGEQIGAIVRTTAGVKPIFVSQGHRVSLARDVELTLAVSDGYRIPRPTRDADHFVRALRRGEVWLKAAAQG